jgi:xanthine dehydrogenase accessory factor
MGERLNQRVGELVQARTPFVHATVVRAQCPTSACPGDEAIVLADGSLEGFVGGQCAESSVRTAALDVLRSGEAVLLRILPEGDAEFPESPGAITVVNPCLSGGALEIFLEPRLPAPLVCVAGNSPIAQSVVTMARALGFDVSSNVTEDLRLEGALAVIVASHGRNEVETIRSAIAAGVPFIGLVASRVRGADVLAELDLDDEQIARVHTPVGLEIGARTAQEVALSIMAEVVRARRVDGLAPTRSAASSAAPTTAVDPVCGMTVIIGPDTPRLASEGHEHWFCSPGCLTKFAAEPARLA